MSADERKYPVIVTGTTYWLVWVDGAESAGEATRMVSQYADEYIENTTPYDGELTAEQPDEWGMWGIYSYAAPNNDAHVWTHRAAIRGGGTR